MKQQKKRTSMQLSKKKRATLEHYLETVDKQRTPMKKQKQRTASKTEQNKTEKNKAPM